MKPFLTMFFVGIIALGISVSSAHAELRVDVTKGTTNPIPIAITNFVAKDSSGVQFASSIPEVVAADLSSTGLFRLIDPRAFIQDSASMQTQIRFNEWKAINAQALVNGTITKTQDGRTRVEFRLFDVYGQQQLTGMAYMTTPQNWRRIAHIIADDIYKRLTGESGYFDSVLFMSPKAAPR